MNGAFCAFWHGQMAYEPSTPLGNFSPAAMRLEKSYIE
jgi:hypothetical protein